MFCIDFDEKLISQRFPRPSTNPPWNFIFFGDQVELNLVACFHDQVVMNIAWLGWKISELNIALPSTDNNSKHTQLIAHTVNSIEKKKKGF